MDRIPQAQRSKNMAAIRGKDTNPELRVRRLLHSMGYRFRLHRKELPGTPDIVLPKYRLCIFVHGCYWHQHQGCKRATIPDTRSLSDFVL
jgi:DNA mismatch endonuclease, patch repair protein